MIKILAIDDNNDNLISLKAILNDVFPGAVVLTSHNGQKGIELAIAENPDVILLDIVMPEIDGFEVCLRLKKDKRVQDIPVVFITALKDDKESRIKALEIGAEGFISKPIDESELTAQIRAMLKIKAASEQKLDEKARLIDLVTERTKDLEKELQQRKIAEDLLRESEFFFKESQRAAFVGSYKFDLNENHWSSSEILNQIFGIDVNYPKNLEGWLGIAHPEDRDMMDKYFAEEVVGKHSTFNKEYRIIRKSDGETRWVLGLGKLLIDENGTIGSMMGTIQDITERILSRKAITENENKYRELFESNSDSIAIFQIGPDHNTMNFVDCNENNARLLGYTKEEIFQLHPSVIEIPISNEMLQWRKNELLKNGQIEFETKLNHKSGYLIDVDIKAVLINFNNQPAIMNISRDITKRKQIEEKIKLLAYSLESISECVSITDNNDHIIYVNKSFLNTYGYSPEELIGQHTSILRSKELAFEHVKGILPITIEGGWRGEIMNKKKDGTLFPVLLSTSIIKDENENPIALIGVATDITDMRKARAELIAAKEQAEESNRLKSAFLNNMSHEIRTPMNHIMGFSSLMSEAQGADKDEFSKIILNSSNQLLTLIENVILLSRLQSEKMEINQHVFVPEELLSNLGNLFRSDCQDKNINLEIDAPLAHKNLKINSDLEKIKQILINLTSNAVKYTEDGLIKIGYDIQEDNLKFYVKDSGIGIPNKEQEKIFDSFYRSEQAISMAIGGTGLGLSIVKELVESMNGTLWFESEPGKGSCFYFSIPVSWSKEISEEDKIASSPHLKMKDVSILIADDEQINFLYLEILLKKSVKKIDHAYNGKEAIEMVSKHMYDLIFMDLKMPEINGYDATKKIKLSHPTIPIIAQTAYASVEDKEKAVLAGFDDFIAKPIRKNVLLEVIEKYI